MKITKCHSVCLRESAEFDSVKYRITKGGLVNGKAISSSVLVIWGKLKEAKEEDRHIAQALYFPMDKFTIFSVKSICNVRLSSYILP